MAHPKSNGEDRRNSSSSSPASHCTRMKKLCFQGCNSMDWEIRSSSVGQEILEQHAKQEGQRSVVGGI
ncbi:hypothetical protein LINPERPRIM_LOCUS25588 [Linum perenne]